MKLILALGAAFAATTMVASAQTEQRSIERTQVFVSHAGAGQAETDADDDGWISRSESSAAADRMFGELDRNDDGRLNETDRQMEEFDLQIEDPPNAPEVNEDDCTRTERGEGPDRQVTIVCATEASDRRVIRRDREVIIRPQGEGAGETVIAPSPPHPPMMWMMLGEDSEADLNNDGALSQDEFRAQRLRMFDAQDVNGDGRVRAPRMPEPPTPPIPPTPPTPPRRG